MADCHIYIVFSSTPNRMGRLIRLFTGEAYNHVSIALDQALTRLYSFSRRYYRTPLYGGFGQESLSRYHPGGRAAQLRVCQVPVTEEAYNALSRRLEEMDANRQHYLYNHLGALAAVFHRSCPAKDARICVEFVTEVLRQAAPELPLVPGRYYSVGELMALLKKLESYTGPAPEAPFYDEAYYAKRPVPYPVLTTLKNMFALLPRLGKK